ncbi:MAG TPA: phosphoribosyltransferase family protein [Thermoanaerobaculia bacterium]|nr:phosphoribosyltransferase family protein [Thermoanaerobaculia bacterium]
MQRSLRGALSIVGREALRIVLPSWCVACEAELPWRDRTASCCASCWASLPKIDGFRCRSCALPLPSRAELCLACEEHPLPLGWCDAWGEYRGPLERVLQALKFERHDFLDDALSALLEETLRERGDLAFHAIAGVPMSRARERQRGYNQAELLARALARRIGVRCDMTLLQRSGERATQSTLPKRERAANVRGAFAASSRVKGTSILLVDDICTTGETLRACATALHAAGAARVCAVTVAKAK